jgi:hypothetical protein
MTDNIPLSIVKRRLHAKKTINSANMHKAKEVAKLNRRVVVVHGSFFIRKQSVTIDESKNQMFRF